MRCATCIQDAAPGKSRCQRCLEVSREITRRYRARHPDRIKCSRSNDRAALLARGVCPQCRMRRLAHGKKRCRKCLNGRKVEVKRQRQQRAKEHLCLACGSPAEKAHCRSCLDQYKIKDRALRDEVLAAYGNACACCGERERSFLQIDHKHGKGREDRMAGLYSARWYRWLKKNGFPDDYQLLCANCNWGRHLNGGICPHQTP